MVSSFFPRAGAPAQAWAGGDLEVKIPQHGRFSQAGYVRAGLGEGDGQFVFPESCASGRGPAQRPGLAGRKIIG